MGVDESASADGCCMNALIPLAGGLTLDTNEEYFTRASKSPETVRAYKTDWKYFEAWCMSQGYCSLPASPEAVSRHLAEFALTHSTSAVNRRRAAIGRIHELCEQSNPCKAERVRTTWEGIARAKGTAPTPKRHITPDEIRAMVECVPGDLAGLRDRAILLLGFMSGLRRSEIGALRREDIEFVEEGLVVTVRRSKTDQRGEGEKIGVPYAETHYCAVRAILSWIQAACIGPGPLFRQMHKWGSPMAEGLSGEAVSEIVKKYARMVGLDPKEFAGHSLRSGFATAAAMAGCEERDIMRQTRHKDRRSVQRYIRDGSLFLNNPAGRIGL